MRAQRTFSDKIFAFIQPDRGVTIVTASSLEDAHRCRRESGWKTPWGRIGIEQSRIPEPIPVTQLVLGVGPRHDSNAPTFCRMKMPGREIAWTAIRGRTADRRRAPAKRTDASSPIASMRIWSYVWQARELVFFDAPDFERACDRALARAKIWGFPSPESRAVVSANIEPIDRLGICLRPPSLRNAPERYWAWIEGVKVGWPQKHSKASAKSMPVPPTSSDDPAPAYALPPGRRYLG